MSDEQRERDADLSGASAPEPSLVARQAAATEGSTIEAPGAAETTSTDRVDARAAAQGLGHEGAAGEQAATTDDLAGDAGADPLKRT